MSEKSDDELPFVCNERGCGMRFTNEDHLSVHMKKHDLCLALCLTPGGISPSFGGLFTDQTPTPTKFLKSCEEIGLFQDLVHKNPFEDSFKKAMGDHGDNANLARSMSHTESGDLDTPKLSVPKILIGDNDTDDNTQDAVKPPKPPDITISSIVPKKRKKFLRTSFSQAVSTTSDEEDSIVGSTSTIESPSNKNNQTKTSQSLETGSDPESVPISAESMAEILMASVVSSTSSIVKTDAHARPVPSKIRKQEVKVSSAVSSSVSVAVVSNSGISQLATQPAQAVQSSPQMIVVLMQLPNGQTIPVQIPVSNIASSQPLQYLTAQSQNTPMILHQSNPVMAAAASNIGPQIVTNGNTQAAKFPILPNAGMSSTSNGGSVYITLPTTPTVAASPVGFSLQHCRTGAQILPNLGSQHQVMVLPTSSVVSSMQNMAPVASVSSSYQTAGSSGTTFSGSQSYTKERLKAAIKQQTTPTHIARAGNNLLSTLVLKIEPNTSVDTVSSSSNVTSPEDYSGREVDGADSNDDSESKRSKFLERNRAAAARCRQKRKKWVETLEKKASDLATVNNRLNSEINKLRSEVAGLKTLLLAHKDCPVTQQQRIHGQLGECDQLQIIEDSAEQATTLNMRNIVTSVDNESHSIISMPHSLPQLITPMTLKGNQSTAQTIVSLQQAATQSTMGLPVTLVHAGTSSGSHMTTAAGGMSHLSVITGPNTISLLPKILNFDGKLHIVTGSRT
ncbi:cyclic AMP-dependent transcription factor ATF-2-like [Dreissena polymorpha]|uniref:Cyclic AMP-dependent transcription factor ATF-2 n=1 Tax=Dreissena polymorpha TaxID=45954 RepID=A0A9D3YJF6_DREPO|nr:cyclic AMP-dependent transcription factor ATF-2-like [Dreissena polymorpha]KAH3701091.1 hypothetical protein DPMN_076075 [Dreissena polymorpha]